jgi:hypothetical protein
LKFSEKLVGLRKLESLASTVSSEIGHLLTAAIPAAKAAPNGERGNNGAGRRTFRKIGGPYRTRICDLYRVKVAL